MGRHDAKLSAAKRAYRNAKEQGNHQEEARWANVIGDILKNRGEYVEALKWLKIDYEISVKYLTQRHCLPTCQSLGEVYLRLEYFSEALIYQKKHLELAKDTNDLVEQQRASTQLGRTYHEMFIKSEDDHCSIRNAKKYFKAAMKLAQTLKENPPINNCSFLKEYIDSHNNIGMLEIDLDNFEKAEKILTRGLQICDEEEVMEDDDGRSRLHHNLGNVFMELRMWDKAREHIEKDILICKRIEHCQGEAKGYINLGELHNRVQKYDEALCCYRRALGLAKSMEDEDALVRQIDENIKVVNKTIKLMEDLKTEELKFKKLTRDMSRARGTPHERNCLLRQNTSIDDLIERARELSAWLKLREFAKSKKRIASELCDREKLSDSYLAIGESYQKLRKFSKSLKWYMKSWEIYKSIGNQEGQALTKFRIGEVLDSDGNWQEALEAFEESYRIAVHSNLPSVELSALENMHYSQMIRFDNVEESRRLQLLIDKLKHENNRELETQEVAEDHCSETDTEGNNHASYDRSNVCFSPKSSKSNPRISKSLASVDGLNDDVPLISLVWSKRSSPKMEQSNPTKPTEVSPKCLSKSISNQQTIVTKSTSPIVGRKRVRIVLSDDEDDMLDEVEISRSRTHNYPVENVTKSDEFKNKSNKGSPVHIIQDVSAVDSNYYIGSFNPVKIEESFSSHKTTSPYFSTRSGKAFRSSSNDEGEINVSENLLQNHNAAHPNLHAPSVEYDLHSADDEYDVRATNVALGVKFVILPCITFKVGEELICLKTNSSITIVLSSIESLKVELACLYYLRLPMEKRSEGLFPIVQLIKCGERVIESLEAIVSLKGHMGKVLVEAFIDGWVQKRLIKLYIDCCEELSGTPNMKLLKKLYDLEVSDDEVIVSECDLQDLSIIPLLNALHAHKTFAMLDLSHNLLGNGTMEKLQHVFTLSGQKYGGLMLDLHCNRFGPTALFQICECPVLFARLEVLNVSGNRLTDACASYLSTILEKCQALCSLNIEHCSITSRTIQKVADALGPGSVLEQLCIGHNNPISRSAITNLLDKLATLKRFSKLSLNGLKLSKHVIDCLCQLAKNSCLSTLMLGETGIGINGALQVTESLFNLTEEAVKLDLSCCGLTSKYILNVSSDVSLICGILELNLSGNPIMQEGSDVVASLLSNPQCCLKVLVLSKCQLGVIGILQIVQALAGNGSLEELSLANNACIDKCYPPRHDISKGSSELLEPNFSTSKSSPRVCMPEEDEPSQQDLCVVNTDYNQLEVADSEDGPVRVEAATSGIDDSCASSSQRKFSSPESQFIQELSSAICNAKILHLLDLSNNGLSTEAADMLYTVWSSSRPGSACKHIQKQTIHLSMEGIKCCVKPCCRKD